MISSCDVIMTVRFYAFHGIVSVEAKLLQNLLIDGVVKRHELLLWEKTFRSFVFKLFEPRMSSYFIDCVALAWINLQYLTYEMSTIR